MFPARVCRPALVSLVLAAMPALASTGDSAAAFLELRSEPDGRCQILSQGGKLRVLHNHHAERAIEYRLVRVFAGDHPQGLSDGVAPPGEPVKLGCTEVDGRPQDWVVQRARFAP
jgi:hypothetical protein